MARNLAIQHIRTTRANLDTQATANNLKAGELYLITDENRIAIGLTVSTYEVYSKYSETHLLSGNQTVNGIKTFGSFPVTPSSAPTSDYQVANKKYVDDNAAAPDYTVGTLAWADVSAETATQYSTMQQVTGINVPTAVLIQKSTTDFIVSLWVNTSSSWTGAKQIIIGITSSPYYDVVILYPSLYYGFKAIGMFAGISDTVVILNMGTFSSIDTITFSYPGGGP